MLKKKGGIVWASDKSPILFNALCSSHLSSLCELFNNSYFKENVLEYSDLKTTIEQHLSAHRNNKEALNKISGSLDLLDGVRTIQILRALSLVTIDTSKIRQLSLGAGAATKDIMALHALPIINRELEIQSGHYLVKFHMSQQKAENIVVSDNDPQRQDVYEELNKSKEYGNIIALNVDTYEVLEKLPELDKENNIGPRNFIVALRIDHRMLPDINQLFKLIYSCMDQTADLVITTGSGFTVEEFQGRVDKIQEIFDYLNNLKLEPVLIKLHDKGDINKQRETNKFSRPSITTYQILHCKLKKKVLKKVA